MNFCIKYLFPRLFVLILVTSGCGRQSILEQNTPTSSAADSASGPMSSLLINSPGLAGEVISKNPSLNWSVQNWVSWREARIAKIFSKTYPEDLPTNITRQLVIDESLRALREIEEAVTDVDGFLRERQDVAKELENFVGFIRAQSLMADAKHQLGFVIQDAEYYERSRKYFEFPELLKDQSFLKFMADPTKYKSAFELLKKYNEGMEPSRRWKIFPFEAQFIKSIPDEGHGRSYGRLLVLVPNHKLPDGSILDRWFLYSLAMDDQPYKGQVRPVSLISVVKHERTLHREREAHVYFMDFIRERQAESDVIELKPTAVENHSKNCYDCHKAAVISIRPKSGLDVIDGNLVRTSVREKLLDEINKVASEYEEYGRPDWGYIDLDSYGPSLGPEEYVRTDEFFDGIVEEYGLDSSSYPRLREAMECSWCHEDFAPLNYLQAVPNERDLSGTFRRKESMVRTSIVDGWMPPDNDLSSVEREVLYEALAAEYANLDTYQGVFFDWLRSKN